MEQLIEVFHSYLDELYYEGFAEFLLQNDVKKYEFEFYEFSRFYGF